MKNLFNQMFDRRLLLLILMLGLIGNNISAQLAFTDVTQTANIDHGFKIFQGTFGGGAAIIDFDNDGWEDVFLAGGAEPNQLLRNQGNGTFQKVTNAGMHLLENKITQGAAVADVNKDGWPDLYITTIAEVSESSFIDAQNVLLINNQDGTFSDRTKEFGLTEATFSMGASFGDINRDGYPDLYVANYFDKYEGRLDQFTGPVPTAGVKPAYDLLYLNLGGEKFQEISKQLGMNRAGLGFQGLWTDIDNDHDLDLLVANDFGSRATPNLMYRNNYPELSFTEIGKETGFDIEMNAMGLGACDINMDGKVDYLITNMRVSPFLVSDGANSLKYNQKTMEMGTGFQVLQLDGGSFAPPISWGINFFDADNDMDPDAFISNGCLNPTLAPNPNLLLEFKEGKFLEVGSKIGVNDPSISRGSVTFDYDNDGDMDLLVVNQLPYSDYDIGIQFLGTRLYRNDSNNTNNWLEIQLVGSQSDTQGIGSRIEVKNGSRIQVSEIYAGSSHLSQNSLIAHFGLGENTVAEEVVIKWSSGQTQTLKNIDANQKHVVYESDLDIELAKRNEFHVYPNPFVNGRASLQFSLADVDDKLIALELFDIATKKVVEIPKPLNFSSKGTIGLKIKNKLIPGIYFLRVTTTKGEVIKKVVLR